MSHKIARSAQLRRDFAGVLSLREATSFAHRVVLFPSSVILQLCTLVQHLPRIKLNNIYFHRVHVPYTWLAHQIRWPCGGKTNAGNVWQVWPWSLCNVTTNKLYPGRLHPLLPAFPMTHDPISLPMRYLRHSISSSGQPFLYASCTSTRFT